MKLSAESESFKGLGTFRLGHFEILSKENLKNLIITKVSVALKLKVSRTDMKTEMALRRTTYLTKRAKICWRPYEMGNSGNGSGD